MRGGTSVTQMKVLRRALLSLAVGGMIAGLLRVRGKGGVPPQHGGWRELPVDRPS